MSEFILRNMEEKDIDTIYKHIHESFVNKYFKNEKVQKEFHRKKYETLIHSQSYLFHFFESSSDFFIALVSYNLKGNYATVRIFLNKDFRGKNYSKKILGQSIKKLKETRKKILRVEAYILDENTISKKLFLELGFGCLGKKVKDDLEYLIFSKSL